METISFLSSIVCHYTKALCCLVISQALVAGVKRHERAAGRTREGREADRKTSMQLGEMLTAVGVFSFHFLNAAVPPFTTPHAHLHLHLS